VTAPLNVAMLGATGRMGRSIVPLILAATDLQLTGALAAPTDGAIGVDAGVQAGAAAAGVAITADPARALDAAQVAIEFTLPQATMTHARLCAERACAMVIGTTGHEPAVLAEIEAIARIVPIVLAPNMSLGVNVLLRLAELAARALDEDYDAEIYEAHHRHKVDAPSGTALALGRAVAAARGKSLESAAVMTRQGNVGARPRGAIGFSVARGGDIVGDHRLTFAGPGEQIELTHHAQDRSGFARGALVAARWVAGRPPALYTMREVLGL
jgi:4-hydroxy-tetrahydrodipicolinate reductase